MLKNDFQKFLKPSISYIAHVIGFLVIMMIPISFIWLAVGGSLRNFIDWVAQFASVTPESLANSTEICEIAKRNPHCNRNKCEFVKDWFTSEKCTGSTLDAKHFNPSRRGGSKVKEDYRHLTSEKSDFKHVAKFAKDNIPCNRQKELEETGADNNSNATHRVNVGTAKYGPCIPVTGRSPCADALETIDAYSCTIGCDKALETLQSNNCQNSKLTCPYVNGVTESSSLGTVWYVHAVYSDIPTAQAAFNASSDFDRISNSVLENEINAALSDGIGNNHPVYFRKPISLTGISLNVNGLPLSEKTATPAGKYIWKIVPVSRLHECGKNASSSPNDVDDTYAKRNVKPFSNCANWLLTKPSHNDSDCESYIRNNVTCNQAISKLNATDASTCTDSLTCATANEFTPTIDATTTTPCNIDNSNNLSDAECIPLDGAAPNITTACGNFDDDAAKCIRTYDRQADACDAAGRRKYIKCIHNGNQCVQSSTTKRSCDTNNFTNTSPPLYTDSSHICT